MNSNNKKITEYITHGSLLKFQLIRNLAYERARSLSGSFRGSILNFDFKDVNVSGLNYVHYDPKDQRKIKRVCASREHETCTKEKYKQHIVRPYLPYSIVIRGFVLKIEVYSCLFLFSNVFTYVWYILYIIINYFYYYYLIFILDVKRGHVLIHDSRSREIKKHFERLKAANIIFMGFNTIFGVF